MHTKAHLSKAFQPLRYIPILPEESPWPPGSGVARSRSVPLPRLGLTTEEAEEIAVFFMPAGGKPPELQNRDHGWGRGWPGASSLGGNERSGRAQLFWTARVWVVRVWPARVWAAAVATAASATPSWSPVGGQMTDSAATTAPHMPPAPLRPGPQPSAAAASWARFSLPGTYITFWPPSSRSPAPSCCRWARSLPPGRRAAAAVLVRMREHARSEASY